MKYKKLFKENSIPFLKDPTIIQKLFEFISNNPFPVDDELHKFAQSIGIEPDKLETYVYAILSVILTGGKSKGKEVGAPDENKNIGDQIELEHVRMGIDNNVVKLIERLLSQKIRNDHLAEDSNYYLQPMFKKELEKEKNE